MTKTCPKRFPTVLNTSPTVQNCLQLSPNCPQPARKCPNPFNKIPDDEDRDLTPQSLCTLLHVLPVSLSSPTSLTSPCPPVTGHRQTGGALGLQWSFVCQRWTEEIKASQTFPSGVPAPRSSEVQVSPRAKSRTKLKSKTLSIDAVISIKGETLQENTSPSSPHLPGGERDWRWSNSWCGGAEKDLQDLALV